MAESTMAVLTAACMLIGLLMFFSARFFRTADAPRGYKWNPREWTPIWKQRAWFRSPGFALLIAGYAIFAIAFVVRVVVLPLPF